MAPSKPSIHRSTDTSMSIRAIYSSHPQYPGENDYQNLQQQQSYQSISHIDQTSSFDYLSNPVDLQDPFFSASYWESPVCLSSRFENEYGRVHSPSLSTSYFNLTPNSNIKGGGGGAGGNGGVEVTTAVNVSTDHHARDFETAFCRDFYCCGTTLCDLHDLLQHYEECHVRFEEEEDDDDYDDADDIFGSGADSECCDEDTWSESDSLPSSPSIASPLPLSMLRIDGTISSGCSDRSIRSASIIRNGINCGSPHQRSSVFDHHHHRHIHHQHSFPNIHSRNPYLDSNSPTTQTLDVISATFGVPAKRKAVVSLADLYVEEDFSDDSHSSAFGSTSLRSSSISNRSQTPNTMNEGLIGPLMKRQTLESNWYNVVSGHPSSTPKNPTGTFPSAILGGDGKPIGPLIGGNHRAMFPGGANIPPTYNTNGTNPPATVDWMRQRDEVFSILEDMTKAPPNIPDEGKPYRCTVPGCDKAYKNPNGLKYHNQHGHSSPGLGDADNPEARPYVCNFLECGKRYKNLNGLKYHLEHTHPNMIAALKAHQAALMTNMNPLLADGHHQAAAMTIAAALAAIEASPTMAMASNAILTAHATAAATAAAAAVATSTAPDTVSTLEAGPSTAIFAPMSDVAEGESAGLVTTGIQNLSAVPVPQTLVGEQ